MSGWDIVVGTCSHLLRSGLVSVTQHSARVRQQLNYCHCGASSTGGMVVCNQPASQAVTLPEGGMPAKDAQVTTLNGVV